VGAQRSRQQAELALSAQRRDRCFLESDAEPDGEAGEGERIKVKRICGGCRVRTRPDELLRRSSSRRGKHMPTQQAPDSLPVDEEACDRAERASGASRHVR
jgi:hypothetical protein